MADGCCVYVTGLGCGCWLCICVCIHIPRWDVHGVWVWALGVCLELQQVYEIALQYLMCVVCEVCEMVLCDLCR